MDGNLKRFSKQLILMLILSAEIMFSTGLTTIAANTKEDDINNIAMLSKIDINNVLMLSNIKPVFATFNNKSYAKRQNNINTEFDFKITATHMSVSSVKVTWEQNTKFKYNISCIETDDSTSYAENIYLQYPKKNTCYITGLRENTEYKITVKDLTNNITKSTTVKTEQVDVIQEFDYEDGWTNCFAYEAATGLTLDPSWSAIQNAIQDPVTNTGIMRNEYGDYCVAMGLHYGVCNDRFLVELENGTQFTVKICDSKGLASDGEGKYHQFDENGKCIIEFIHSSYLPACVTSSGNYGSYNWYGLNFDNIKSIKKINYNDTITY